MWVCDLMSLIDHFVLFKWFPSLKINTTYFAIVSYVMQVNIRGPKDDVDKAKQLLVSLSNEKQLNSLTAEVRAKPEHHKFLIGRQGKITTK